MKPLITRERVHQALRSTGLVSLILIATLVVAEIALRIADPRIFREDMSERSLTYDHDAELGWSPRPNTSSVVTMERTIHVQHNKLGLRDIEFKRDVRPTLLFIGDSLVWGADAEASERFTDILRSRIASYTNVNAGVSGFGTDQEYLWLQRLWPKIEPAVVVLIFCFYNDRSEYRQLWVPDPTERLVGKIRDFVTARGARLFVGLQLDDDKLVRYLQAERIPFVTLDGAEAYSGSSGAHWTPAGHRLVADRLLGLLVENNLVEAGNASVVQ